MTALSAPSTRPRRIRQRPVRSSRPYPVHGEVFEDVMLDKSGRLSGKRSASARSHDPVIAGTTKRRNELILADDPAWKPDKDGNFTAPPAEEIARRKRELALRLAFSRHPKWLGVTRTRTPLVPEYDTTPAPRPALPLLLRVPEIRHLWCRGCLRVIDGKTRFAGVPDFPASRAFTVWLDEVPKAEGGRRKAEGPKKAPEPSFHAEAILVYGKHGRLMKSIPTTKR